LACTCAADVENTPDALQRNSYRSESGQDWMQCLSCGPAA
jgi:hypothetical protein